MLLTSNEELFAIVRLLSIRPVPVEKTHVGTHVGIFTISHLNPYMGKTHHITHMVLYW